MTPQELEFTRLNARVVALECLVVTILSAATRSPAARQSLLETLEHFAETADSLAFPESGPAYSDLVSGEADSAFRELADFVKRNIKAR